MLINLPIDSVQRIRYDPPGTYPYGVEIVRTADLFKRANADHFKAPQRVECFVLLTVTTGELRHVVDFIPYRVAPGEWLLVKPNQIQRFDASSPWDGFVLPIRAEFLDPLLRAGANSEDMALVTGLQKMPTLLRPPDLQSKLCTSTVLQMNQDACLGGPLMLVETLLRQQLRTLVTRLILAQQGSAADDGKPDIAMATFSTFRKALEEHFHQWHDVHAYASLLGHSERTLGRACRLIAKATAKELIDARVVLEAKRMLTHTLLAANRIGLELGFEDASHFVKFFKRVTGCSPGEFRRLQVDY